jgi:tetratricopeptide (TPR) repeat protein
VKSTESSPRSRLVVALLGLVALTIITYLPALSNGFIWDDNDHFTANPAMTAPGGLRQIWTSLKVSRYYPLTLTTFWVQRRLWGLETLPYHAFNVGLHALSAALLFVLLRRLNIRAAWVGAALWAIHPVNVESVAWVTELKNVQSGLFFFLALVSFLRFESTSDRRWYGLAAACGAAAMLSKPSTVVLPAVLLLLDWWQRGRVTRADILRALPFAAVAFAMSAIAIVEQYTAVREEVHDWSITLPQRFAVAARAVWFYAGKLMWPLDLAFVYPQWKVALVSVASLASLVALIALPAVLWLNRRQPWARAGLLALAYFVVALAPVLGFFNIYYFRYSFIADHFQYLASVGPLALIAAAAATLFRGPIAQRTSAFVALAALAALSAQHCRVFHDDERLWRDTIAKSPRAFLAHNNLGLMAVANGRFQEGEERLREALRIKPDYVIAHNNLGLVLATTGRREDAIRHFREALRLKPHDAVAHGNLALALAQSGRYDEALDHYREAVRLEPRFTNAQGNFADLLLSLGQTNAAFAQLKSALEATPDWAEGQQRVSELLTQTRHDSGP